MSELVPHEMIENKIFMIRGHKVMLDKDLAMLYDVKTKALNKAVTRNVDRFPSDFMFRLSKEESTNLKFHFGTSSWGGKRKLSRVFTKQGVAMLSGILTSKRAVHVNIIIMRAFVKLREILSNHKKLAHKLSELEGKVKKEKWGHPFLCGVLLIKNECPYFVCFNIEDIDSSTYALPFQFNITTDTKGYFIFHYIPFCKNI